MVKQHRRLYHSGSSWVFWRWTDTPSGYITRLHLIQTPFGAICLHWLNAPDEEPWLHDHPVTFLSLILRGAYEEIRWRPKDEAPRRIVHRWWNFIRADINDCHNINVVLAPCLTLCFMGTEAERLGVSHG